MSASWQGRDWQNYCILLLQKRYATQNSHSLQLVPDRHQGDLGLEAFSHDGHVYQCYAAEEPLTVIGCYEKQRDKLTTDLGKLRDRKTEVASLLGRVVVHRYVFMIHRHDSRRLISHAHSKAEDVRSWNLPFVADEFSIVVETDDDYANEREAIHALPKAIIESNSPTDADRAAWGTANADLHETALNKLERVAQSRSARDSVLTALINQYLKGENALERLKNVVPETHRGILAAKAHREDLLVLEHPPESNGSHKALSKIAGELAESLHSDFPTLSSMLAETLAWSAVADWLMRCPLDFEEADA
ncbi:hypothetical protein [Kocuria carniphila]|uniref:hypothetical protein n=1 Tax=Kocuria carniphila TaxID=262208 RepID=UPI00101B7131|nr:hypothetical protein [Kocuria carniphila]